MSDSEFIVNGKPVSPWVGWPIAVGVLLLVTGLIAFLFMAVAAYASLLLALVFFAVVMLLPFDLALRMFGRKGFFEIKRSMKYYDGDDFWSDDDDDDGAKHQAKVSFGNDEWQRTVTFGTRPLHEAVARK
jgi:hypothetical protein